jgi:hypothetical protein
MHKLIVYLTILSIIWVPTPSLFRMEAKPTQESPKILEIKDDFLVDLKPKAIVELKKPVESIKPIESMKPIEQLVYRRVCSTNTFKSWMSFRAITSPSSRQYKLQSTANTNTVTGQRTVGDYIMVAMSGEYGPVGSKYIVTFLDESAIKVIIGDIKHEGCTSGDSSMIEFIVDPNLIPKSIITSGNYNLIYKGKIVTIVEDHSK